MSANTISLMTAVRRIASALLAGLALSGLALALITAHPAAASTTFNVNGNCVDTDFDGLCDDNVTYKTIAAAMAAASNGDTINIITSGLHTELGLTVSKNLIIQGQGMATTIVQAAAGPNLAASGILTVSPGVSLTLSALTLRYGNAPGRGGAIYNHQGSLTLSNVAVLSNTASDNGGGIYNEADHGTANLLIVNSLVQSNTTHSTFGGGGGLYNDVFTDGTGTVTIQNSRFFSNTAPAADGGAIGNSALDPGSHAILTVVSSTLAYNVSGHDFGGGGAIYNFDFNRTSTNTTSLARTVISSSVLYGNQATGDAGGAIFTGALDHESHAELVVFNSTLSGNSATSAVTDTVSGGGIHVDLFDRDVDGPTRSAVTVTYSTLYANLGVSGLAVHLVGGSMSSTVYLNSSILTGNAGSQCTGGAYTGTHNLIDDVSCGAASPFRLGSAAGTLGPLANNGGPTLTDALLPGSPAIGAGDSGACPPVDQRGWARAQDGVCDAGAYEVGLFLYLPLILR
jgi:hypothetical protein